MKDFSLLKTNFSKILLKQDNNEIGLLHTSTIYILLSNLPAPFPTTNPCGVLIIMAYWKLTLTSNPQTNISTSLNLATHPMLNNPFPSAWPYD